VEAKRWVRFIAARFPGWWDSDSGLFLRCGWMGRRGLGELGASWFKEGVFPLMRKERMNGAPGWGLDGSTGLGRFGFWCSPLMTMRPS